jgi:hypothetical protein
MASPPSSPRAQVTLTVFFALAAGVACAASGPGAPKDGKAMTKQERRWEVRDGETLILELSDTPGTVSGPGGSPAPNALLTARIVSRDHEARLRSLLEGAGRCPNTAPGSPARASG